MFRYLLVLRLADPQLLQTLALDIPAASHRCPPLAASRCVNNPAAYTCLSSGFTAFVYETGQHLNRLVLKQKRNASAPSLSNAYRMMDREVCTLNLLRQFAWAPKVLCVYNYAYVMQHRGWPRCRAEMPVDYEAQVQTIVKDMLSVGVRHNDMLKPGTNDFVVDSDGRVSLVDFGWASVNGSFAAHCTFGGASYSAPDRHPTTLSLQRGIRNLNETNHSVNTQAKCIGASPVLHIRNWRESVNVSVLPGAAPGAELHLLIFWRPSAPASAAAYDLAVRRFHDSIVGETVHLAFGDATLSATKLEEFYRTNLPVGVNLKKDPRGREPFVILFLRLLNSSWTTCSGGISSRGQALCPPTNSFKMQVRASSGVDKMVHATDNSAELQSNLRTLDVHVQEASVGARRVRVGTWMTTDCTRDPACPLDPACFPRSLPMVMTAATKFAAASDDRLWSSVVELLHGLHDAGVAYSISRNWERGLPSPGAHPDVDLFVSDYELTLRVIGGKRHTAPGRILLTKLVGDRVVSFDPRYVGDGYIDPAWMTDAIRRRRPDGPTGTFVLAPVDHFFFLLYHALVHKRQIAPDYDDLLQHMGQMLPAGQGSSQQEDMPGALLRKGSLSKAPRGDRLALLQWFMFKHNYSFTRPTDPSVVFNIVPDLVGESRRPCGVSELLSGHGQGPRSNV